jgi:Phosphotransferase enzyme family
MCVPTQFDHRSFRILLYRKDASELLVEVKPHGCCLPVVVVPEPTRIPEGVTAAIRNLWNLETYCLFELPNSSKAYARYQVAEACAVQQTVPAPMQWLPVNSLSTDSFLDVADFQAMTESQAILDQYRRGQLSSAFGKPGWLGVVRDWVTAEATKIGLRLTGNFLQLGATPSSSLMRFATDGPALWFKAVGAPQLHEYSLTWKLATSFSEFLPQVLAWQPDWHGWLAIEAGGSSLDATSPARAWEIVAESLARLQLASLGRRFELIAVGAKDVRPSPLRNLVRPFFASMEQLMAQQTKPSPAALTRNELLSLASDILSALEELQHDGMPNALGHLDLNQGNLVISGSHCIFLDWAEAYVGPPVFSLQYLIEFHRRLHGNQPVARGSLLRGYAKHWDGLASSREIATSLSLAPLLAVFTYGSGGFDWRNLQDLHPKSAAYLRAVVRRMKQEASALRERRIVCAR